MNCHIRPFKNSEFKEIQQWYIDSGVNPVLEGMLVEDGTFVLEINNIPAICQTVLLPQSKSVAYLEYLIKNPMLKDLNIEHVFKDHFLPYLESYAKNKGYQHLITYSPDPKLSDKYERVGFTRSLSNLTAFFRSL